MAFVHDVDQIWLYETGEDDTDPMRPFWRILHLPGNAWVHNTLVDLGRQGLRFSELRFFLCKDAPKRAAIHPKLKEVKRTPSDQPALGFHLPPYNTTPQLSGDLKGLARLGYLIKVGDEWCLRLSAYENLVNEWERDRDVRMIQKYGGGDVVRHGHHARVYAVSRSLLTPEEVRTLEECADMAVWLTVGVFQSLSSREGPDVE